MRLRGRLVGISAMTIVTLLCSGCHEVGLNNSIIENRLWELNMRMKDISDVLNRQTGRYVPVDECVRFDTEKGEYEYLVCMSGVHRCTRTQWVKPYVGVSKYTTACQDIKNP